MGGRSKIILKYGEDHQAYAPLLRSPLFARGDRIQWPLRSAVI
jgi:hypothetical protein